MCAYVLKAITGQCKWPVKGMKHAVWHLTRVARTSAFPARRLAGRTYRKHHLTAQPPQRAGGCSTGSKARCLRHGRHGISSKVRFGLQARLGKAKYAKVQSHQNRLETEPEMKDKLSHGFSAWLGLGPAPNSAAGAFRGTACGGGHAP